MDRFPRSSSTHSHLRHGNNLPSNVTTVTPAQGLTSAAVLGTNLSDFILFPPYSALLLAAWEDKQPGGGVGHHMGQSSSFEMSLSFSVAFLHPLCVILTPAFETDGNRLHVETRGKEKPLRLFTVSVSLLWIDKGLNCTIPLSVLHSINTKESRNCMNVQFIRFAKKRSSSLFSAD